MQTQYYFLLLDLVILLLPFLANLYFRIGGIKTIILNFLKTYSVVGVALTFIFSLIYSRGDWQFNTKFITGVKIGNLPIEVVLFLFVVPFACIALYELINYKVKEKRIVLDNTFFYLFAFTYFALAVIFSNHTYSSNIFLLNAVLMLVVSFFRKNNIFLTKNFYVFNLLSFVGFLVIAAIITSTPFVTYSTTVITGFKIGAIAFEDLFTSFFVLSSFLTVYYIFKKQEA